MNSLKIFSVGTESIVLGAVGTVAYGLVVPAGPTPVVLGTLAACLAVEATRLPLVMRAQSLGPIARCAALGLALCASTITFETLALGVEATLDARAARSPGRGAAAGSRSRARGREDDRR